MSCDRLKVGKILPGKRIITKVINGAFMLTGIYGLDVNESQAGEPCRFDEVSDDRNILGGSFVCHRCGASFTVKPTH
jgi:hypothetical protein